MSSQDSLSTKCTYENISTIFWATEWENKYYQQQTHSINASFAYWLIMNKYNKKMSKLDLSVHATAWKLQTLWEKGQKDLYMQLVAQEFEQHRSTQQLVEYFALRKYINRSRNVTTRRTKLGMLYYLNNHF